MELNWFTPDDAKDFVEKAIKEKLLNKENDKIIPSFDISKISVPIGYAPVGKLFEKKKDVKQKEVSVLDEIIDKISKDTNKDKKKIYDEIKFIEEEKNIEPEIASLIVGKKYNIKFDDLSKKIEEIIFR
jgi:hypothetical protein